MTEPKRTLDTMSEAIALSSPSGRMSKRAKDLAVKRLGEALFGPGGLQPPTCQQPNRVQYLEGRIHDCEAWIDLGFRPRLMKRNIARYREELRALGEDA